MPVITVLGRWRQEISGACWPACPARTLSPKYTWKTLFWNKRWRSIKEDIHLSSLWTHMCLSLPDVHTLPWTATTHKYILTLVSNSRLNLGCLLDSSSELFKILMSEHSFEPTLNLYERAKNPVSKVLQLILMYSKKQEPLWASTLTPTRDGGQA